jgi:hypothetical protein
LTWVIARGIACAASEIDAATDKPPASKPDTMKRRNIRHLDVKGWMLLHPRRGWIARAAPMFRAVSHHHPGIRRIGCLTLFYREHLSRSARPTRNR